MSALRAEARLELLLGGALLTAGVAWALAPELLPRVPCVFRALTGHPCVACGGTRALAALRDLDLGRALAMNPLVTLAAVGAFAFVLYAGTVTLFGARPLRPRLDGARTRAALGLGLPLALAANWLYLWVAGR